MAGERLPRFADVRACGLDEFARLRQFPAMDGPNRVGGGADDLAGDADRLLAQLVLAAELVQREVGDLLYPLLRARLPLAGHPPLPRRVRARPAIRG